MPATLRHLLSNPPDRALGQERQPFLCMRAEALPQGRRVRRAGADDVDADAAAFEIASGKRTDRLVRVAS
jgi:hypothetical protein